MIGNLVHLGKLVNTIGGCDGRVTVVDAVYDETHDVTRFEASHDLGMFIACADGDEGSGIGIAELIDDPGSFYDIRSYGVYALMRPGDRIEKALPVTGCSLTDDGHLLLFV